MTLRVLALALAVALAVPAIAGAARMALAARDRDEPPARRRLEALWVAVPVALLAALVALVGGRVTTRTLPAAASARPLAVVGDYVRLTKPRIISLLLVTTAGAMFVAAGGVPDGWLLFWTMVGGYLAAGGANAINHYIDRDIDGRMSRTTGRPVVAGRVSPARALAFGVALGRAQRAGARGLRQLARGRPGAAGPGALRRRLHALAEAHHRPQHRDRGLGRRGAAAGGLGGRDRRPRPVGLAAVRDRLLLDAARTSGRWR